MRSLRRKDTIGIILLGDERVGKTGLIERWVHDKFSDEYKPTIEDFHEKNVIYKNRRVNVTVVDIAGSRQFPAMEELYIVKSDCIVFVYEIGNEKSIKSIEQYFKIAREKASKTKKVRYYVIGTKHDMLGEGTAFSNDDIGSEYFSELGDHPKQFVTSAKNGKGIHETFDNIITDFVTRYSLAHRNNDKQFKEIGEEINDDVNETDDDNDCCCCCCCCLM